MKKLLFFLLIILLENAAFALDELKDVGIAKYAVLEVLNDNTPLRSKDNESAERLGHLFKNTVLFADKQNKNYYRIELDEGINAWVNKKFVEVQAIIPEKRFDNIKKISFKEDKKFNIVKIETKLNTAYMITERGKNLDFKLFDNRFDPIETKIVNKNEHFSFEEKLSNNLNLNYINNSPLFGYGVEKFDNGYIVKIKKPPKISKRRPLKNIIIVLDPGHGGSEKGACAFGLEEKTLNLQISKKLARELRKKGAKVYLTRKKDKNVDLYARVEFAREKNADILVSIHQNSLANPKDIIKKHGVGTYYYHPQSKPLAQKIQQNLINRTNFKDDKVNHASFALTRPSEQLSVLVECGYIIREEEAKKLSDKKFQKILAKAILKGIEDYLKENF